MKIISLLFAFYSLFSLHATAGEYPVAAIPKQLLKYANAVIRKQEQIVEIRSLNKVTVRDHYVITILNEKGEGLAYWQEYYSKFRTIHHVEGVLFDAAGNKVRSLKKSEIKDQPVYSASNLIDDSRIKYHNFYCKDFPYTVEYESEMTKTETMFLPDWSPLSARNVAVEESICSFTTPVEYRLRFKAYNMTGAPVITTNGKTTTNIWKISQQPAIAREYASPAFHELAPYISFGPTDFKLDDFSGSLRNWNDYGKFMNTLISGLDEIPQNVKDKVVQVTSGAKSTSEKLKLLYDFLQQNTHYISVQLGVGGWRPFPASYVASNGYGDCKALSNYMVALLKVIGIKANYVLILAGQDARDIATDFPSSQFNHVICAVPMQKDTLWLECTSQTVAPGYMGSFTGNRHALMITDNGGEIVSTPRYDKTQNIFKSTIQGTIDAEGNLLMQTDNFYQAECSDDLHMRIHAYSKEDQLKFLKKSLDIPHYDIGSFSYAETRERIPSIRENLQVNAPGYAQITGKRLFVYPNICNRWDNRLAEDSTRLYAVDLVEDRTETDSVKIKLPAGYTPESIAKPFLIQTPYGNYSASITIAGDEMIYYRKLSLNKGRFPATEYSKLVQFYEQLFKADRAKVVLVKSGQ
jgi:Domain of Unknown Function with PDB structure (DUF3857)/Transglutaminase-like superfamily